MKYYLRFARFFVVVLLLLGTTTVGVLAAPVINEIYPAPDAGEFEWIEIYNNSDLDLSTFDYNLTDLAGNKIKWTTDTIDAFSFLLATASAVLNNTGDTIFLKNSINEIVNIATYSSTLSSLQSYSRCPDGGDNWIATTSVTKNSSNLPACFVLTPTPTSTPTFTPTPTAQPTPFPTPVSFGNIFLSEVMVNPLPGENEWVEFYNDNDFPVDLADWYVDDKEGAGSSPKKFSLEIPAKSYKVYVLTSSVFNNDGDSVRLLDFNKTLKDDFEYFTSIAGQTYGRALGEEDFCLQASSYEAVNNSCLTPLVLVASMPSPTMTTTKISSPAKPVAVTAKPVKYQVNTKNNRVGKVEVLGVAEKKSVRNSAASQFSFLSFSHSLLTMFAILFKMKFKYAAPKKILLSFLYPPRGE